MISKHTVPQSASSEVFAIGAQASTVPVFRRGGMLTLKFFAFQYNPTVGGGSVFSFDGYAAGLKIAGSFGVMTYNSQGYLLPYMEFLEDLDLFRLIRVVNALAVTGAWGFANV